MIQSIIFLSFSLFLVTYQVFGFDCSDLVQSNLCLDLSTQGCSWDGSSCGGTFIPSCVPPDCYYVDNTTTSKTQTGTAEEPLATLSDGFRELLGKVGTLVIINPIQDTIVELYEPAQITAESNITVKPLFSENRYTIDFHKMDYVQFFVVQGSLKITSAFLSYFLDLDVIVFWIDNTLIFENVDIANPGADFLSVSPEASFYYNEGNVNGSSMTLTDYQNGRSGQISFKNVKFFNNINFGAYLNWETSVVNLLFENCLFSEGSITTGFALSSQSQLKIINCTFENLLISNLITFTDAENMTISNSIFRNLTLLENTTTGAIRLRKNDESISSFYVIENCSFSDISVVTTFIFLDHSGVELHMMNVSMNNIMRKEYNFLSQQMTLDLMEWSGGLCCLAHSSAVLQIESSSFVNISSHCLGLLNSQLSVKSTTFDNSQLTNQDSVVNSEMIDNLRENSGVTWINLQGTSEAFADGNQIVIAGNKFRQNSRVALYGGALRFGQSFSGNVLIALNEFIGNSAHYGGAIFSHSTFLTLDMSGNIFSENLAFDGGCVYKTSYGTENSQSKSNASVILYNNTFKQNTARRNGGSMFLNWESIFAKDNSFISNQADENGGAIYFSNFDEENNEKFGWLSNTNFIDNSAKKVGGALKLSFDYSKLNEDQNYPTIFLRNYDLNNQAVVDNNPSYYLLSFFDILIEETPDETFTTLKSWVDNHELTRLAFSLNTSKEIFDQRNIKHKSGNPLSQILRVQIFDEHHKPLNYIDDGRISFQIIEPQDNTALLVFSPIYFTFRNGEIYARSTLQIIGKPKTTATLQLQTIKTNSAFLAAANSLQDYNFTVELSLCEIGDIFKDESNTCETCPSGSYSFGDPYQINEFCLQCPPKMKCLGGNKIAVETGYWRFNTSNTKVVRCEENFICKGGLVNKIYYPHGLCSFPNEGNMCNECPSKYAKFGSSNVCVNCQKDIGYHIKAICFFILQMVMISFMFRLNGGSSENSERLNIMKILVNFIHINSLIIQYNLNWPSYLLDPVKIANTIIPVGKDGFSIDCLIALNSPSSFNNYLIRLFITFFQPVIIWIFIMICYASLRKFKKDILRKEGLKLFLIISFVVQPNIIINCLEIFRCQNVSDSENPKYFIANNPSVECWTKNHLGWALGVALPFFLIWGVALPFAVFMKAKKSIHTQTSCSFLYQGLKEKLWYWEFILLLRKILIIFVFTALKLAPLKLQIMISFTIFLIMSLTMLKLNPYLNKKLYRLEYLCTNTLTFMAYVGSFFLSDSSDQSTSKSFGIVALILNFAIYLAAGFCLIQSYLSAKSKPKKPSPPQKDLISAKPSEVQCGLKILTSDIQLILNSENDVLSMQKEDINSPMSRSAELDESSLNYDKFSPVLEKSQKIDNFSVLKNSGFSNLSPRSPNKQSNLFRESLPSARDHLMTTSPRETITEFPQDDLTKRESIKLLMRRTLPKESPATNRFRTEKTEGLNTSN